MFEHLYLPKPRQARPAPPPRPVDPDAMVRLTKKGALLLEQHQARRYRQGRR